MKVLTPINELPKSTKKSVFLAGPTPRDNNADEKYFWRRKAIKYLEEKGYDGIVFSPDFHPETTYEKQVSWENKCLNLADIILFWIPRDLKVLPGFTTNIEYGEWMKSGKIVLGFPEDAEHVRYLKSKAELYKTPVFNTLENSLDKVLQYLNDNESLRENGEINIPLHIWKHPAFQQWYKAQKNVAYNYETKSGVKTVQAATMFDINTAIMRCLAKNLALFGLGMYIYAGEDLPEELEDPVNPLTPEQKAAKKAKEAEDYKKQAIISNRER